MGKSESFEKVGECLYRNPSKGTIYALLKIRGKQIKRSLQTNSLPEARRKLRDFQAELKRIDPSAGRTRFSQIIEKYPVTISHQGSGTIRGKMMVIARMTETWPGGIDRPIRDVKPSDVVAFLSQYPGASRHAAALQVVRAVFAIALKDRIIASSPAEGITQRKQEKRIRQTPSPEEFKAIVQSIRSNPQSDTREESSDFVAFMGLAGLGQAEASSLTWGDVDFKRGQIVTFRHKTRTGFAIPIFPQVRSLLECRHQNAHDGEKPPAQSTRVFNIADCKKAIATACRKLGLPPYTARSFRRMFITRAIEKGVDVKVIALWQGHKDGGKLILDTYSHVRPAHSDAMAALMTDENASPFEKAVVRKRGRGLPKKI